MNYKDHPDYKEPRTYSFSIEGVIEYIIDHNHRPELHREDGPAVENPENDVNQYFLYGNEVDPEEIVDLWLIRGIFCYYDNVNDQLMFE